MLSLRPRLMLTPTFSMDTLDTLDMLDIMDTPMPTMDIMASVLLMLSPRLMLILTFSMEVMDILDMPDTTDIPMPTTGYYGKRSADAEPKADADPYLLYGGYG